MEEINLYKLLRFYVQNWLLILSVTLAGLAAGLAYNEFIQVPMYKSNATLLFVNPNGTSSTQDATRLSNYVQLFQSRRVLEPVISKQELGVTYDQFTSGVSATNTKGTEVIILSVSTDNPAKSQNFLREAVVSFKDEAEELYGVDALTVVDNASSAEPPYNVKKPLQLAIATGAGFVLSLIVLFFIYDASGGKAGKLGSKKGDNKKAKRVAPPATAAPAEAPQPIDAVEAESVPLPLEPAKAETPKSSESKTKAFFAQLRQDFKDGLWIEQPVEKTTEEPAKATPAAKTAKATAAQKTVSKKPAVKKATKKTIKPTAPKKAAKKND